MTRTWRGGLAVASLLLVTGCHDSSDATADPPPAPPTCATDHAVERCEALPDGIVALVGDREITAEELGLYAEVFPDVDASAALASLVDQEIVLARLDEVGFTLPPAHDLAPGDSTTSSAATGWWAQRTAAALAAQHLLLEGRPPADLDELAAWNDARGGLSPRDKTTWLTWLDEQRTDWEVVLDPTHLPTP